MQIVVVFSSFQIYERLAVGFHRAIATMEPATRKTAKEWKNKNSGKKGNLRDYANITQLVCLSNLETLNAEFIRSGFEQQERLKKLNEVAIIQMRSLVNNRSIKKLR